MAYYDLGPKDAAETLLLTHGEPSWSAPAAVPAAVPGCCVPFAASFFRLSPLSRS